MDRKTACGRVLVFLLSGALLGCGDRPAADASPPDTSPPPRPGVATRSTAVPAPKDSTRKVGSIGTPQEGQVVKVTMTEWRITVSPNTVEPGQVTIVVENQGKRPHVFEMTLEGGGHWKTSALVPGDRQDMTQVLTAGAYTIYCPDEDRAGNHRDKGMEAKLLIR